MSTFVCDCDYDGYWEFHRVTTPRSRKLRCCSECGGPIGVGEQYERQVGKWEGDVVENITCARCLDVKSWMLNSVPCFCWNNGCLLDDAVRVARDAEAHIGEEAAGLGRDAKRRVAKVYIYNEALEHSTHRFFDRWVWGEMISAGLVCA